MMRFNNNRMYFPKWIMALVVLFFAMGSFAQKTEKPNIILIMADDVSWEAFGCYGTEDYLTPNIDKLAEQGVRFEHCYSMPICTPSRVMIMTGKYNFRNYTHFGYLNPEEKTFGNLMQEAGYKTAIAGKWQLNGLYNNLPGCDDNTRPYKAGFDEYCLWQLTKDKKVGERYWNPPMEINGRFVSKEENKGKYGPDILCDFVCGFMEKNAQNKQPFFAYYPMVLVHDPFLPTPATLKGKEPTPELIGSFKDKKANFQDMVNYMDGIVGKIVAKTEALGIADNTVIIFTADNGTNKGITSRWNGMDIKGGKGGMKDMGTHVPLVVYWKGHSPEGKSISHPVDFTDLYPTLAELAGIKLGNSDPADGYSFASQVLGKTGKQREVAVCHYQPYWNQVPGQFVRTSAYKLYNDGRFYTPENDLKEENDLSGKLNGQQQKQVYRKLKNIMDRMPLAPSGMKDRNEKNRPTYPDWQKITDKTD